MLRAFTSEEARLYDGSAPRRIARPPKVRQPRPIGPTKLKIIEAIWRERSYKEIAFELNTTKGTIAQEVVRISRRLQVRGGIGIALWWERNQERILKDRP